MKSNSYFPHDANAKDDPKCVLLIEQLGMEGYGIFWVLVETLREQPDFKYPVKLLPAIARRYNTSYEKVKAVVFGYKLFKIEGKLFFYSESLIIRMSEIAEKKLKYSNAGKKGMLSRWKQNGKNLKEHNDVIAKSLHPYNDVITNKGNENKLKKSKLTSIPDFQELKEYALDNKTDIDLIDLELKYKAWKENDWKDGNGKPIFNWKTKLLNTLPYLKVNVKKSADSGYAINYKPL